MKIFVFFAPTNLNFSHVFHSVGEYDDQNPSINAYQDTTQIVVSVISGVIEVDTKQVVFDGFTAGIDLHWSAQPKCLSTDENSAMPHGYLRLYVHIPAHLRKVGITRKDIDIVIENESWVCIRIPIAPPNALAAGSSVSFLCFLVLFLCCCCD